MIWIDYVIVGIIVFSAFISLIHGFLHEVLSLTSWICAFFIASHYYHSLAVYFSSFEEQMIREIIAITLLLIAALITGAAVNCVINAIVVRTSLSGINLVLGFCLGALRGILIVSAALFFLDTFASFSHNQDWQQSQLIPQFNGIIRWFYYL